MKSPYLPADQILIHGLSVMIKSGYLRRASQIVKHSRFLRNLKVSPMLPEVGLPQQMEGMAGEMDGMNGEGDFEEMDEQ